MRRWTRSLMALGSAAMVAVAMVAILASSQGTPAEAASEYTIDILPGTFNPDICRVSRNDDVVYFRNKDSKPRRIVVPLVGDPNGAFRLDTGVIPPGERSVGGWAFSGQDYVTYQDFDRPSLKGTIDVPQNPGVGTDCAPRPPTPTPTNTPTITPTRTPTPIPTPTQQPPGCTGLMVESRKPVIGCGVAVDITSYGPLE